MNIQAEERVYSVGECGYIYRNSIFKRSENKSAFVTYVRFRLSKEEHYTLDYGTIRHRKYESIYYKCGRSADGAGQERVRGVTPVYSVLEGRKTAGGVIPRLLS